MFASGNCLIFPKYYPFDKHICMLPLIYRQELVVFLTIDRLLYIHRLRITKKDLHERYNLTSVRYTFLSNERHPKWDIVGSFIVNPVSYDENFSPTGTYPGFPVGESTLTGT